MLNCAVVGASIGRLGADLERALDEVNVLAYAMDRNGVIVWQNEASRREIGDVRGVHFNEFVVPEDRARAQEKFASKVLGNAQSTEFSITVARPSGERVEVEVSSVPLRRGDEVVGVFGIVAKRPVPAPVGGRLTRRQLDVVRLLANGASTAQIAEELHIAPETVRNHVRMLLAELGVHSRVEAVAAARAAGIVD